MRSELGSFTCFSINLTELSNYHTIFTPSEFTGYQCYWSAPSWTAPFVCSNIDLKTFLLTKRIISLLCGRWLFHNFLDSERKSSKPMELEAMAVCNTCPNDCDKCATREILDVSCMDKKVTFTSTWQVVPTRPPWHVLHYWLNVLQSQVARVSCKWACFPN